MHTRYLSEAGRGTDPSPRIYSAASIALLLVIVLHTLLPAEEAGSAGEGVVYGSPRKIAILSNEEINESSGMVASRVEPGLFWTHNDSGDKPRIFAFDVDGKDRGEFRIPEVEASDWEDMATVSLDGKPHLVLADVGDNARRRESCSLYVVSEPTRRDQLLRARRIRFRYQDGPRDCEAMAIDPVSRRIILVTKALSVRCSVYQLAWPVQESNEILVAIRIGEVRIPLVTAMDIADDGRRAVLATYADAYEYYRRGDESWREAFARSPRSITMPQRRQGEAICFGTDGKTLYLTSERTPTPLWRVAPLRSP